ncbi:MAG: hypothetical protein KKC79_02430 [Gammaproteobacteria bacterium]|nr:hypothetical protein [Gammaproteobacteria bacterium]MBU1442413.1 hypothetical protein [Gammaproteobacteria bacterium]MBU2284845.1 hypothetical protein [Gammaproteobacteria bacterium]MBU2407488.1 hypothetical protein [Gammaproteobacteria bacterium]
MDKLEACLAAMDLAIKSMDAVFMRLNAAEYITPKTPLLARLAMTPEERDVAERAEVASYDVASEHWSARLCLMAAWEAMQAARRMVAATYPEPLWTPGHHHPIELAGARASILESGRLAHCALDALETLNAIDPDHAPVAQQPGPSTPQRPSAA